MQLLIHKNNPSYQSSSASVTWYSSFESSNEVVCCVTLWQSREGAELCHVCKAWDKSNREVLMGWVVSGC